MKAAWMPHWLKNVSRSPNRRQTVLQKACTCVLVQGKNPFRIHTFYFINLVFVSSPSSLVATHKGSHTFTHTHTREPALGMRAVMRSLFAHRLINFKKAAPQTPRGSERRQRRVKGEARCERMERECMEKPLRQAGGATHLERDAQPAVWNLSRVKCRSSARLWTPASVQCLSSSQRCFKPATLRGRLNRLFFFTTSFLH